MFRVELLHLVEGPKAAHDVLVGLDPVYAQNDLPLAVGLLQLLSVRSDLICFGELPQALYIDRDWKIPNICVMVAEPDPAFPLIDMRAGQVKFTGADEIQPIFTGLEAEQIHGT